MIIHTPKITKENDEICISADIELDNPISGIPNKLWYRIPKDHEKYISTKSDSFLVAMLQLAKNAKEDIEVKGTLSPKLYKSIQEYQAIFNTWCPKIFRKRINITCNKFEKHSIKGKKHVACSFSGGLDSTYTFYNHLPEYEQDLDYQLSSVLFIHSSIFSNKEKKDYEVVKNAYKNIVNKHDLTFFSVRTNAADFEVKKVKDWVVLTFGSTLTSAILILGNAISRYYISSSYDYSSLEPCGSHPMVDHLLSTESLEIIHHGADVNKMQKTEFISQFPETYTNLRVCWKKPNNFVNCCCCGKCLRTMTALALLGKLHEYKIFPLKLTSKKIRQSPLNHHNYCYAGENLAYAKKIGRKDIAFDINYAIFRSKFILPFIEFVWKLSAKLKKRSKIYRNFVKLIK